MKKLTFLLSILIGWGWGCTPDSLQSNISPRNEIVKLKAKNDVPFKGSADGFTTYIQDVGGRCANADPRSVTIGYEGTGNVTHMGSVKLVGSQCSEPNDDALFVDDEFVLIAANNDEVHFVGNGRTIPTANLLVFNIEENYIITGGTGRFKNVSGQGKISGQVIFTHLPPQPSDPPIHAINIFDGVLTY